MNVRTRPRSGFDREGVASSTVTRTDSTSPGRTGSAHLSSSIPGDTMAATCLDVGIVEANVQAAARLLPVAQRAALDVASQVERCGQLGRRRS